MPSTIIEKWVIGAPEVDCVLDRALWLQYTWRSRYCRARWFLYCWTWASRPGPRGSRRMIRRCFTQSEHLAWWDSALMRRRSWKSFIQTSWVGCAKTCCHPSVNTWNCLESSHPVMCLKMRHWQKKIISMIWSYQGSLHDKVEDSPWFFLVARISISIYPSVCHQTWASLVLVFCLSLNGVDLVKCRHPVHRDQTKNHGLQHAWAFEATVPWAYTFCPGDKLWNPISTMRS